MHLLYFTDKVCCEPLTPYMHFANLRLAQPEYMERLIAMLQALAALADDVCNEMKVYLQQPRRTMQRFKHLEDGIPYMLHDSRWVSIPPVLAVGQSQLGEGNAMPSTRLVM